ncbi:MAG: hypothetical protein JW761_14485 [Prolixibacteraceae bacterium]|nr:hypothetical protein [Prolixibacteraceae bacterium]
MKHIICIVTAALLILSTGPLQAQDKKEGESRWEKFRAEKVSFLTEKLELTPTEAQKFWPVYNELEKSRWEAQKTRRELEVRIHEVEDKNLSKKEIIQLTRDYSSSMEKEGQLYVKYNDEFLKILPPEKVLKLYRSENEFRMHMIRKFRDRDNNK